MPPSSSSSPTEQGNRTQRKKRSGIACRRCHGLKVKCSGDTPCQRCRSARKASLCEYPHRGRTVTISASYLEQLRNDYRTRDDDDQGGNPDSSCAFSAGRRPRSKTPERRTSSRTVDPEVSNPIHEPRRIFQLDSTSQHQFVGESTCLAFSDRLLQVLNPQPTTTPPGFPDHHYVRDPIFTRQLDDMSGVKLPERIRVNLLVRVALRFIGQDYHFFLHRDFLQQLESAYATGCAQPLSSNWVCKLYVVLALGELYSTAMPVAPSGPAPLEVPGTEYFKVAVGLLQDLFEEPSMSQIEIMLLFSFYSNALGRVKSAHMYSGMAMRLSTCLGLHRRVPDGSNLSSTEREHRIRLWWTVYVFDRSTCSKLGQPLTIQDSEIDVGMPSSDVDEDASNKHNLGQAEHLIAHINLARITGLIMSDIYAPSSTTTPGKFVQNVRSILQELRRWDSHMPESLGWKPEGGVPRPVASLHLFFNQCIILTTRAILLYVFRIKNPFNNNGTSSSINGDNDENVATMPQKVQTSSPATISDATKSLADSCISAARMSNSILSQLFVENSLAICGYFDAHHLFSSTLVLIISAIINPNSSDSDAVQTAFQLLMVMRDRGNIAAGEYFQHLVQIQLTVSKKFSRSRAAPIREGTPTATAELDNTAAAGAADDESHFDGTPCPPFLDHRDMGTPGWGDFLMPDSLGADQLDPSLHAAGASAVTGDPLDHPILQAFLDNADSTLDDSFAPTSNDMGFVL